MSTTNEIYNKVETDNPLLDEIIYNCKLILRNCIIKDSRLADSCETVDSLKDADIYAAIKENRTYFLMFDYSYDDLIRNGFNKTEALRYMNDNKSIPKYAWDKLTKYKVDKFLEGYEEKNDYYRRLMGLPGANDKLVYVNAEDNSTLTTPISTEIPIHLLSEQEKETIRSTELLERLIERYPDVSWLKNFNKGIDSYAARKLPKFGLVYIDDNVESVIYNRFKQVFETNRIYIIRTMDKDAYRYYNKYYDRFLMMLMMAQTFCDMISEMPDYFIRRDVFDIRTCEYFFDANGVEFFPDIPLKFQKKLVQNLNLLLKYSSTQRNIVDICSIFGFKNSDVFKYYLLKEHIRDSDGRYKDIDPDDLTKTYTLRFVKVPLTEEVDKYVKDSAASVSYENIVSQDQYWNGPFKHEDIRQKIMEREFSLEKSKYLSIDAMYDLTENSFTFVYFINMLMWSNVDTSKLTLKIPQISNSVAVPFVDVVIYLYSLMYLYMDIEDLILQSPSQYLTIKGFNFEANLTELSAYVAAKGYTLDDLGVSGFQIPNGGILSLSQMINIFINNKDIYNHVKSEMMHADNRDIYLCYKKLYESLFYMELTLDYYKLSDGTIAPTYSAFLQEKNPILYGSIQSYENITDKDARDDSVFNQINVVSNYLLEWIDNEEFDEIFMNLPCNNKNFIQQYMCQVIEFFLSYKNTLLDFGNIYRINDEYVYINDSAFINYVYDKNDYIKMLDIIEWYISILEPEERDTIPEDIITSIERIFTRYYDDEVDIDDKMVKLRVSFTAEEWIIVKDKIERILRQYYLTPNLWIPVVDKFVAFTIKLYKQEKIKMDDCIAEIYQWFFHECEEDELVNDKIVDLLASMTQEEWIISKDVLTSMIGWYERVCGTAYPIIDKLHNSLISLTQSDRVFSRPDAIVSIGKWLEALYEDKYEVNDELASILSKANYFDIITTIERIAYICGWHEKSYKDINIFIDAIANMIAKLNLSDNTFSKEDIIKDITRWYNNSYEEKYEVRDKHKSIISYLFHLENFIPMDVLKSFICWYQRNYSTCDNCYDAIGGMTTYLTIPDSVLDIRETYSIRRTYG